MAAVVCPAFGADPRAGIDYHPARVLVQFKSGTVASAKEAAHTSAGATSVLLEYEIVPGLQLVAIPKGRVVDAVADYAKNPNVVYAEPDWIYHTDQLLPNDGQFTKQ